MTDPYLDALEQLDQMRDRAFKAEAAIARVRDLHGLMVTFPPDVDIDSYRRGMYDAYQLMVRALDGAS